MWELLPLPLLGLLIGTIAAITGIGGGAFIVPLLTLIYAFTPPTAVGTSLTIIIFTAIASTVNYSIQKRIYYKIGLVLATTTVPGAYLGAYLTSVIPPRALGVIFGIFLVIISLRMIIAANKHSKNSKNEKVKHDSSGYLEKDLFKLKKKLFLGIALNFFAGVSSGLLGIGGGVLSVPIMTLVMGIVIHVAVATSMFTMIITSISGVIQHYMLGNICFEYVLPIALGTIIGAQLGAYTSKKLSSKNLHLIFGFILIAVSIQMILKHI